MVRSGNKKSNIFVPGGDGPWLNDFHVDGGRRSPWRWSASFQESSYYIKFKNMISKVNLKFYTFLPVGTVSMAMWATVSMAVGGDSPPWSTDPPIM